jgi:outer membrane immunogenic protein
MKKIVFGIAALATLFVTAAQASPPSPPVMPDWNWTGIYVGGNAGYGGSSGAGIFTVNQNGGFSSFPGLNANGGFGGGQIGVNYQINWLLVSIEADADAASIKDSVNNILGNPNNPALNASVRVSSFETLRGRVGLAFNQVLVYATGGAAQANIDNFWIINNAFAARRSGNVHGSVWGAGMEIGLDKNWSVRLEYQYFHVGNFSLSTPAPAGPIINTPYTNNFATVRAGLNYKFDWWPSR